MNGYWVAAVWMAMALLASLISIRVGVSVALVEIVVAGRAWASAWSASSFRSPGRGRSPN